MESYKLKVGRTFPLFQFYCLYPFFFLFYNSISGAEQRIVLCSNYFRQFHDCWLTAFLWPLHTQFQVLRIRIRNFRDVDLVSKFQSFLSEFKILSLLADILPLATTYTTNFRCCGTGCVISGLRIRIYYFRAADPV